MRNVLSLMMLALLFHPQHAYGDPYEWQPMSTGYGDIAFQAVALHSAKPHRVFAATERALYESTDNGRTWQERFRSPVQTRIIDVAVDSFEQPTILIATDHGLYSSFDGGQHWRRTFRGLGEDETRCTLVAFHPQEEGMVLLGTRDGLFISVDHGRRWTEVGVPSKARDVVHVAFDPKNPHHLYLLTVEGLFVGSLKERDWQFRRGSSSQETEEEAAMANAEPLEEAPQEAPPRFTAVAIDPHTPSTVYLAGTKGLQRSVDGGVSWQWLTQTGMESIAINQILLQAHSPLAVYAATERGVTRYRPDEERWELMTTGLANTQIHDLAATRHSLWAATGQGLYRSESFPDAFDVSEPPTPSDLLANFTHEPTMAAVREAAIRYAEVHPDKIKRWRRQAALRGLLPTVDIGMDRDQSRDTSIDEGTFPKFQLVETEDRDAGFDASITWELGDLIWNDDQTSIDVRSKLMVQLRDDIVDEVTRTYFERRRLQVALLTDPPIDQRTVVEKELRLQELTALIDGLTGGYFSRQMTMPDH